MPLPPDNAGFQSGVLHPTVCWMKLSSVTPAMLLLLTAKIWPNTLTVCEMCVNYSWPIHWIWLCSLSFQILISEASLLTWQHSLTQCFRSHWPYSCKSDKSLPEILTGVWRHIHDLQYVTEALTLRHCYGWCWRTVFNTVKLILNWLNIIFSLLLPLFSVS